MGESEEQQLEELAVQRLNLSTNIANITNDFRFTCNHIRNVQNTYKGRHIIPKNHASQTIAALRKDMKSYSLFTCLDCDWRFKQLGIESMEKVLILIERIFSSITEFKTEHIGDISYLLQCLSDGFTFVDDQMELISQRAVRNQNIDGVDESLPHLREHFTYTFENVCKPIVNLCRNYLKIYPGIDDRLARNLIEALFSVSFCEDDGRGFKSDIREIRNGFSHGDYSEENGDYKVRLNDQNTITISGDGLSVLDSIMFARSVFLLFVFPLINLEVIRVFSHPRLPNNR